MPGYAAVPGLPQGMGLRTAGPEKNQVTAWVDYFRDELNNKDVVY